MLKTRKCIAFDSFKTWFSKSEVVDDLGFPLVVYHGTQHDFDSFDPDIHESRPSGEDPTTFIGSHFAKEIEVANKFARGIYNTAKYSDGIGGNIIPVFLSIQNIYKTTESEMRDVMMNGSYRDAMVDYAIEEEGFRWGLSVDEANNRYEEEEKFRREVNERALSACIQSDDPIDTLAREMADYYRNTLIQLGHDGIVYENAIEGGISYIAFSPEQVKSAIGNTEFTIGSLSMTDHHQTQLEYQARVDNSSLSV